MLPARVMNSNDFEPLCLIFFTLVTDAVSSTLLFLVDMLLDSLLLNIFKQRMKLLKNLFIGYVQQRAIRCIAQLNGQLFTAFMKPQNRIFNLF